MTSIQSSSSQPTEFRYSLRTFAFPAALMFVAAAVAAIFLGPTAFSGNASMLEAFPLVAGLILFPAVGAYCLLVATRERLVLFDDRVDWFGALGNSKVIMRSDVVELFSRTTPWGGGRSYALVGRSTRIWFSTQIENCDELVEMLSQWDTTSLASDSKRAYRKAWVSYSRLIVLICLVISAVMFFSSRR